MTANTDFDRLLGGWLDEGPRRAPDRPLELALQHARTHPRRPDPLGFLRPDVMAPRRSGFGLRPLLVLAALVLAIAAAIVVGGGSNRDGVQPPVPSDPTLPSPSVVPSASASPIVVELDVPEGQPQTVTVNDESELLVAATSGSPTGEAGQTFPFGSVDVTNIDDTTLQLGWAGYPCATDHVLAIDETATDLVLTRPECEGDTDTIGIDRVLILEFSQPIDADAVTVTLEE